MKCDLFSRNIGGGTISSSDSRLSFPNGALKASRIEHLRIFFSPPKWRNNRKMDAVDATRRKSGRIDTTRVHTKALQSLRDNIGIKRDYPPRIANVTGNITRSPCAVHAHTTRCRYPCEMVIRLSVVIHLWREFRGKNRLRNARIAPLCLISLTSSTDSLASTVDLNLKRDETFA